MPELQRLRSIQYPASVVFTFSVNDTMRDINGVMRDFSSSTGGATYTFRIAALPKGAVVTRGSLSRSPVFATTGSATVTVGDTASTGRYLSSASLTSAGVTNLSPTGYVSDGEDLVFTFSTTAPCTAGKATLEIEYVRPGFSSEVSV